MRANALLTARAQTGTVVSKSDGTTRASLAHTMLRAGVCVRRVVRMVCTNPVTAFEASPCTVPCASPYYFSYLEEGSSRFGVFWRSFG